MANDGASLSHVIILSSLSDAERGAFASELKWRRIATGENVIKHLNDDSQVYFLISGALKVSVQSPVGKEVFIRRLSPGEHFGEIAALAGLQRSVDVRAEQDCEIAECSSEAFNNTLSAHPACALALAKSLAQLVVNLTDRLFELAALETRFRIYAELLRLMRGAKKTERGPLIENMPTRAVLAASIGTQREAVSREINELEKAGIVERMPGRRLLILDAKRLRAEIAQRGGPLVSHGAA
ncbi:MAG: Crp/Fnr family transcriptional regulator [Caulobacteraceae bacterium]|nr:Crp/Fnr family transcriptional regulator [Caulobacteraceae bacterium]